MDMNARRFGLLAVFAMIACAPVSANPADVNGGADRAGWEDRKEDHINKIHKQLDLSPEQEAKLKEHRSEHRGVGKKLHTELSEKRKSLRLELEKPEMDESRARTLHAEIKTLHNAMADHRLAGVMEVRKILTPAQFKKFEDLMHERRENRGKGGRRMGRGDKAHGGEKP